MAKDELVTLLNSVHCASLSYANKFCIDSDHVSKQCKDSILTVNLKIVSKYKPILTHFIITQISEKFRIHIECIATAGTKSDATANDNELKTASLGSTSQFNSTTKVQSRQELQSVC